MSHFRISVICVIVHTRWKGTIFAYDLHLRSISSFKFLTVLIFFLLLHWILNIYHFSIWFAIGILNSKLFYISESYLDLSAQDLEFGFNETRRDRILRTYVRNAYYFHLNEIFSTLKNEYTDWDRPVQNPLNVRDATLEVSDRFRENKATLNEYWKLNPKSIYIIL